jgi:hypothetical protein
LVVFVAITMYGYYVLTLGYKGSLFSFLMAPPFQRPIDTIAEGVNSPLPVKSLGDLDKDQNPLDPTHSIIFLLKRNFDEERPQPKHHPHDAEAGRQIFGPQQLE